MLRKEKQQVHSLCDNIRRRADDTEKQLVQVTENCDVLQAQVDAARQLQNECTEQKNRIGALDKDNFSLHKEVVKLKESLEVCSNFNNFNWYWFK